MRAVRMVGLVVMVLLVFDAARAGAAAPFDRSGAVDPTGTPRAAGPGVEHPQARRPRGTASSSLLPRAVGANVNVIGTRDVVQKAVVGTQTVSTCNPGKQTAQNETTIAVNPSDADNLVAGANDYRRYEPSENRYDGSGGVYRSVDGGATWAVGYLPGLVRANRMHPGPYESAGDPVVSTGPGGTFWYANLLFNRTDKANGIAVSRSTDGGAMWRTSFVTQATAVQGALLFNDKEWIAGDPSDAQAAYVTWTQFNYDGAGNLLSTPIVFSKTVNGGATWSAPAAVTHRQWNQGSVVFVDASARTHVVWSSWVGGNTYAIAYARKPRTRSAFGPTRTIATVNSLPSPLFWAQFRVNSFPGFALDGSQLHVVWANWNGADADIVYVRSTDGGATWSSPVTIAGGASDQFFPWVAAKGGRVFAVYLDHAGLTGQKYKVRVASSGDGGATWSSPVLVSSRTSNARLGNWFGYPDCGPVFIGDYSGIAVGSDGVAHPLWTDIRGGNSPGDPGSTYDQDPYTARVTRP